MVVILRHNKCEKYCEALILPIMIFDFLFTQKLFRERIIWKNLITCNKSQVQLNQTLVIVINDEAVQAFLKNLSVKPLRKVLLNCYQLMITLLTKVLYLPADGNNF